MYLMILGLVLFLGVHSMQVAAPVRAGIVSTVGEIPYKVGYGLISLAGLIIIAEGYKAWLFQGSPLLYDPPVWLSHLSLLLMAFAFVFFVATYTNGYIKRALKHPMLVAIKIWAVAHLIANGHAAAVVLFAAFLLWAAMDRVSVKRRERAGLVHPAAFEPHWQGDAAAIAIGLIVYGLFVWKLHLWLIGVSPIAT